MISKQMNQLIDPQAAQTGKKRGLIKFIAQNDCGCCTTELWFSSREKLQGIFDAMGPTSGVVIRDETNTLHRNINTIYGFWEEHDEPGKR